MVEPAASRKPAVQALVNWLLAQAHGATEAGQSQHALLGARGRSEKNAGMAQIAREREGQLRSSSAAAIPTIRRARGYKRGFGCPRTRPGFTDPDSRISAPAEA